eukprot:GHVT01008861.1.p2 GENE.GHVT01008861.1~~GHVT01008861.1.p2  ORF type:complete len:126 (+),score=22.05 GHVT01008861.1:629-1006(+)
MEGEEDEVAVWKAPCRRFACLCTDAVAVELQPVKSARKNLWLRVSTDYSDAGVRAAADRGEQAKIRQPAAVVVEWPTRRQAIVFPSLPSTKLLLRSFSGTQADRAAGCGNARKTDAARRTPRRRR